MRVSFAIFLLVAEIFLISCDKVKNPIQNTEVKQNTRKVLLEDYTGHQCGNCPAAAAVAEDLHKKYGDKLIVVAVHAGFFAKTSANYPTSYTCQAGNDWDASSGFGISSAGNPNGMVNRKDYGEGLIQKETKWPTYVSKAANDAEICDMWVTPYYDATNRLLNTTVKAKFKRSYHNNTKVTVILVEDSIIGPQKDYRLTPPNEKDPNYVFMHMLRGAVNGTWGTDLKATPIKWNDSVSVSFNNFSLDPKFKEKHVAVIAFVSDAVTREVLQVEKAKIK